MELRLVVEAPSGARSDVLVELAPGTPAGELLRELGRYLELPAGHATSARLERSARAVGGDQPVEELGLRDGDLLVLDNGGPPAAPAPAPAPAALFDLVVLGGPDAGTRRPLPEGRHVIGRGPGAELVLTDRSMSRRHVVADVAPDGVSVCDAGSSNGTFLAGEPLDGQRLLRAGEPIEAGRSLIAFEPHAEHEAVAPDGAGHVAFNRPPRVARPGKPGGVELAAPPAAPARGPLPLGAALIPLALGAVMFAVTGSPFSLMFGLLAPAMAVYTYMEGRGSGRRAHREALATWERELGAAGEALDAARAVEAEARRDDAPDAAALRACAGALDPRLWERRPGDADFLALRLGVGDLVADAQPALAAGGDDALRERAIARLGPGARLPNVPVVAALDGGALGLAGPPAAVAGVARWLVAQAALLHSPRELEIAVAVAPGMAADWSWLKWLPHVRGDGPVRDAAAARGMLARPAEAARRLSVIDGDLGLPPSVVEDALSAGTAVVWIVREARATPGACTVVAEVGGDVAVLRLTDVRSGTVVGDAAYEAVTPDWCEEVGRLLAPVRDAGASGGPAELPARVSLLELLDLPEPTPAAVAARWRAAEGLRAPIGVAGDGPFEIDAGQVEGLRMLLAGMPGTGKSELLQTLIGALAVSHPPTRLTFLLVDYKGGAAFGDCAKLPHTVGLVTDLDARLADRARTALLAELRRREALLAAAGAKSLRDLARRRDADAPPALVIVVDEFATLVREVPAFVDTLVDIAQRGRSLGLHLVLATQRPRGAVSDALRANMNLRLAMRVSDEAESRDIIEAPVAAAIGAGRPGRAIALTGRGAGGAPRLVELQVAYAGGRSAGLADRGAVRVRGLGRTVQEQALERMLSTLGGTRPTDLQLLVGCAQASAERERLADPRPPWLPALPERLDLEDLGAGTPERPVLGLVDEPAEQAQRPFVLDLERDGGMLVYGTSGSGRTALLRTLACSLAAAAAPRDVQIYGLDFASRGLGDLEALPHVGSVVAADDEERVLRLLGALRRAIASRRDRVAAGGKPGDPGFPRVVLLLDGYAGFVSAFERTRLGEPVQTLTRLAADGRPLGVHLVISADRRADVPGALTGVLGERVVLRLAGDDEYTALGVPRAAVAGAVLPPGRGFTRAGHEVQIAWVGPEAVAELARTVAEAHPGETAPAVGRLPARVPRAALGAPRQPLAAVVGLDADQLGPVTVSLAEQHLLVAGPRRSGASTALGTIAASLRDGSPGLALHLLAPRRTPLTDLGLWTSAAQGADDCAALADALASGGDEPFVVVVDDGLELAEGPGAPAVEALLRRGRDAQIRLVAGVDAHGVSRVFGGWLRDLRAERTGLLLQPTAEAADILGVRLPVVAGPLPPGRGFLVERGVARLVQIAES